jgi:hypothetical protein
MHVVLTYFENCVHHWRTYLLYESPEHGNSIFIRNIGIYVRHNPDQYHRPAFLFRISETV